jgi:hypothetical protein
MERYALSVAALPGGACFRVEDHPSGAGEEGLWLSLVTVARYTPPMPPSPSLDVMR